VTNIIDNMNLEAAAAAAAAGHDVIDLSNANGAAGDQGAGAPGESIDQILNNVVAATANNDHHGTGNEPHDLDTTGMDTSLDDILNAAHMGNPEFLDLDMDGMF
jgi:mediator of RNA polymerase II transcription subunit 5